MSKGKGPVNSSDIPVNSTTSSFGSVAEKIEFALVAILIVGVLSLGASILLFRRKIS